MAVVIVVLYSCFISVIRSHDNILVLIQDDGCNTIQNVHILQVIDQWANWKKKPELFYL